MWKKFLFLLGSLISLQSYAGIVNDIPEGSFYKAKGYGYIDDSRNTRDNYISLHPDLEIRGPVYDYTSEDISVEALEPSRIKYTEKIFGIIVASSIANMKKEPELFFDAQGKPNDNYWSFLLSSISIPHHESSLIHFRKARPEYCSSYRNKIDWMDKLVEELEKDPSKGSAHYRTKGYKEAAFDLFENFYSPENYLFPECKYLKGQNYLNQILITKAYGDAGVMAINLGSHAEIRDPEALLNIYRHIDYAMEIWRNNYRKLIEVTANDYIRGKNGYRIASKEEVNRYPKKICSFKNSPFSYQGKRIEDLRAVRNDKTLAFDSLALWSGLHNQGNFRYNSICRYMNNNSYDQKFLYENLYPVLGIKSVSSIDDNGEEVTYESLYDTYMTKTSLEHKALEEIRHNIAAAYAIPGFQPKKAVNLQKLAQQRIRDFKMQGINYKNLNLNSYGQKGNYLLDADYIDLFLKPGSIKHSENYCGRIYRKRNTRMFFKKSESSSFLKLQEKEEEPESYTQEWLSNQFAGNNDKEKTAMVFDSRNEKPRQISTPIEIIDDIGYGVELLSQWMEIEIPSLRSFKIENFNSQNQNCRNQNFWVSSRIGSEQILRKIESVDFFLENERLIGSFEKTSLEPVDQYIAALRGVSYFLWVRKYPGVGETPKVGRLMPRKDEQGKIHQPLVKVVAKYVPITNSSFDEWLEIEFEPGEYGFVPAKFLEKRD
ncbi:MAG: hypothetical protein VX642_10065 [Bdellovibrionota bacterium]|nr:hypothetical protein [Bdellovibrionota bacterium]